VEPHGHTFRILRAEPVAGDRRPGAPGGPELRDLLEEVAVGGEEEREARREFVEGQARADGGIRVGNGVGHGERDLLDRRRSGLAHVVAANGDRVPGRQLGPAVGERVRHEAHRRAGWEDVRPPRDVLLEDVVLDRAPERSRVYAATPRHGLVEHQQDGGRGVDRH
jgi:hypothetical protein